jgi:hypothetical protein
MDGKAYMPEEAWQKLIESIGIDVVTGRDTRLVEKRERGGRRGEEAEGIMCGKAYMPEEGFMDEVYMPEEAWQKLIKSIRIDVVTGRDTRLVEKRERGRREGRKGRGFMYGKAYMPDEA